MLYIFGILSVFLIQNCLLDLPIAPTIGAQQTSLCLVNVCVIFPSPFVRSVPSSDIPTIGDGRRAVVPDHVESDDNGSGGDGGGGRHGERRGLRGRAYGPPFNLAQRQIPPSVEMLSTAFFSSTDRVRDNDTGAASSGLLSRLVSAAHVTGPPHSTPRSLALPHCLRSDKARHIHNLTCPYPVSGNDAGSLLAILPSMATIIKPYPFVQPRCLVFDKVLHLMNDTCLTPILPSSPSIKVIVNSRPAPQSRCLAAEKTLHLLNDTCVLTTSVNYPLEQIVEAEPPMFNGIPYQPISVYSLPCLPSSEARRGAPRNCGYNTIPTLATVLNWDIKSQAILLASQVVEPTPAFLTTPIKPEPPTCYRRRDPSLIPPALVRKRTTLFNSPRLRAIRMIPIIVAILSVLERLFGGMEQTEQLERGHSESTRAVPKVEEPLTEVVLAETVDFVVFKDDALPPTTPKTKPSPTKTKCRMVAGKRVQPLRTCRTPPIPPTITPTSSSKAGAKKGRKAKAPWH